MRVARRPWALPQADPAALQAFPDCSPTFAQVLWHRGIRDAESRSRLLARGVSGFHDPFLLPDMRQAVTTISTAVQKGRPIAIYGDYDADGLCATALLARAFRAHGLAVRTYIPERDAEGYGLNVDALRRLAAEGVGCVISVDCGTCAPAEGKVARELGLELIVTDHHQLSGELTEAPAVINPHRPGSSYPWPQICGVSVAFKLVQALSSPGAALQGLDWRPLLELVAIGSVADLVPLRGENRALVHQGLRGLRQKPSPGVRALCAVSEVLPGEVDASTIGYTLAPRLNAAGRLGSAQTALDLLLSPDLSSAGPHAVRLSQQNAERQRLTSLCVAQAREIALAQEDGTAVLVLDHAEWPAGIVGLVAGRLAEEFNCPAFILERGAEFSRGSARSVAGIDLMQMLNPCSDLLQRYGGHAAAAGFTLPTASLADFAARLQGLLPPVLEAGVTAPEAGPQVLIDAVIEGPAISAQLVRELEELAPCGNSNPLPLLAWLSAPVERWSRVGKRPRVDPDAPAARQAAELPHLKLWLGRGGADPGAAPLEAIAFQLAGRAAELGLQAGSRVDVAGTLELDSRGGAEGVQLRVRWLRAPEGEAGAALLPEAAAAGVAP